MVDLIMGTTEPIGLHAKLRIGTILLCMNPHFKLPSLRLLLGENNYILEPAEWSKDKQLLYSFFD